MKLSKISSNQYRIEDSEDNKLGIVFPREKFEDLYYAIPLNTTALLRLLLDNVCSSTEERQVVNAILEKSGQPTAVLEDLQQQIQRMELE